MSPITPKNILRHELIGLEVKVVSDKNPCNTSIQGTVVDESRNTLLIRNKGETKRVGKALTVFRFKLPDCTAVDVEGSYLMSRPEDRVKRRFKRNW